MPEKWNDLKEQIRRENIIYDLHDAQYTLYEYSTSSIIVK